MKNEEMSWCVQMAGQMCWHSDISLMQISEHSLKGAYPSVDWGPIRDIHTV